MDQCILARWEGRSTGRQRRTEVLISRSRSRSRSSKAATAVRQVKGCTGGRPCANRAGQRLSWSSQTGMGRVDWRICIRCIKLLLIEPCRLPGMIRSSGDTGSRTRQLTRPGSSVASDKHVRSCIERTLAALRATATAKAAAVKSSRRAARASQDSCHGAVIAGAKGQLAKVDKC